MSEDATTRPATAGVEVVVPEDVPTRSTRAKSAKSVFYEEVNDIDIYVEDTSEGYEKIYRELFGRYFKGRYRVEKVFQLGERATVLRAHKSDIESVNRPTLYIVDSDLWGLVEANAQSERGLYVLPCYCIENILVDPVAIGELIFEEDLRLEKEAVLRLFDYRGWHRSSAAALAILFVHYAVAFKLAPQIQTVGFRANGLVKAPTGEIDRRKLGRRICELRRAVEDLVGAVRYREEYQSILEKVRLKKPDILFHVSGKDYLLPLLFMRLKTVVKTSTPYAQLKVRLALKCELRYLEGVDSYIAG